MQNGFFNLIPLLWPAAADGRMDSVHARGCVCKQEGFIYSCCVHLGAGLKKRLFLIEYAPAECICKRNLCPLCQLLIPKKCNRIELNWLFARARTQEPRRNGQFLWTFTRQNGTTLAISDDLRNAAFDVPSLMRVALFMRSVAILKIGISVVHSKCRTLSGLPLRHEKMLHNHS
jgi:hypothetical protein